MSAHLSRGLASRPPLRFPLLVLFSALALAGSHGGSAEPKTAPVAGLRENTPSYHALVGAKIVTAPGKVLEKGTIVLRDGLITAVGADISIPSGAVRWDLTGRTIYAGFIDAFAEQPVEAPRVAAGNWNGAVHPERRIDEHYKPASDVVKKVRSQGVALRIVAPKEGIVKGTSSVVTTGDESSSFTIVRPQAALHLQLTPAGGGDGFPGSPMGALALVRQTLLDAAWYARAWDAHRGSSNVPRPETNESLAALNELLARKLPLVVATDDWLYFLRADALGREFDLPVVVLGSGDEYQRLQAVRASGRAVIVPLNFPGAPNVANAEAAMTVPLERLMHWDAAPENAGRLAEAGVRISLTTHGLKDPAGFLAAIRKAVERGLAPEKALAALTTSPAQLFDLTARYGTLEPGKAASLVVADGDLFTNPKSKVLDVWVEGRRYPIQPHLFADLRGRWEFTLPKKGGGTEPLALMLEGEAEKLTGKLIRDKKETALKNIAIDGAQWSAALKGDAVDWKGEVQLSAAVLTTRHDEREDAPGMLLDGFLLLADGTRLAWQAKHTQLEPKKKPTHVADDDEKPRRALYAVNYPFGDFGREAPPPQPPVVAFRGAVVWTCAAAGRIDDAVVVVHNGRIQAVGRNITIPGGALIVDAKGMHLSPGIIDCHSHIATDGGVNEATQSITSEVRIGDFIDPADINIYRQLAGGVTSSNILHGSANVIGGQNQVVKFRWGALPEEMKFAAAPAGIKFALGENVKRSNWGAGGRYPATRMGVEQLLRDAFRAAEDYRRRWKDYRSFKRGLPPRTDLELEALAEVVEGKRFIHCHSYRQDEILAFLRVCEEFHVRVATLQHILEGYKVADVMAKHGVGGSSFSDWWAYKFEVYDAIPYNGALMHDAGVVVSFNSDDAELARRLNLEAAKAVKYGGVSPEEALKFVTLNPAKQLGIDKFVGSIEPGKDADLVLWNGSPLSALARCEQTWIDGRKYFDRNEDLKRRDEMTARRTALIQRVLASGEPPDPGDGPKKPLYARDDIYCSCRSPHIRLGQDAAGEGK